MTAVIGLGGEGDEQETGQEQEGVERDVEEPSRNRSEYILECGLDPRSLVGSFFHRLADENEIVWKGLIVGEVEPRSGDVGPVYLVELRVAPQVAATYQQLVKWEDMLEGTWRFYDSEEWMEQQERLLRPRAAESELDADVDGCEEADRRQRRPTTQ